MKDSISHRLCKYSITLCGCISLVEIENYTHGLMHVMYRVDFTIFFQLDNAWK